jgi:Spy/CpxP family protein refolding chaperone
MTKFVVILGFILSFAAGLVIGSRRGLVTESTANSTDGPSSAKTATTQSSHDGERRGGGRSGFLTAELGLTSEQRKRLDEIWSAVAKASNQDDVRRGYRRERDAAIADLVPAPRLADYDQIINTYHGRIEALERTSREAYESAVEQTKSILTPPQRTRYEELLKRHRWGPGGSREKNTTRPSETRATSQPEGGQPIPPSHDPR